MIKHSKQRDLIIRSLQGRYDHPTAEMLYSDLRQEMPSISLGTIYRNLTLLTDMGVIIKIPNPHGPDRFDGNPKPHNHFLCKNCGCVLDLEMDDIDHIKDVAGKNFAGLIDDHVTLFRGTCPDCIKKS